uniref:RILP-like protein 1 n=1 Tax=Romanomermis culicivorax TaxID=13658 RepID=A0A915K5X2_ROMCU
MVENHKMSAASTSNNTDSPSRQVTVVDVYDLASVIGKDFERIIDHHGSDSVAHLMPKELEQIEENYRSEIRQLWDMVQKLQEENKRLSNNLENKAESPTQQALKEDLKVMMTLQENVEKQRDSLKILQKETDAKSQEMEKLQRQLEKQQRTNKELTRKNKIIENQSRILIEEKVDLISTLQDREQSISQLQIQLGETEKAKKDLEESKTDSGLEIDNEHVPKFSLAELREVLKEKNSLKSRVLELEEELTQLRPALVPSPNASEKLEDEDLVVYGPINKEPEEKLFPWKYERKDSGVRKFLMNMFRKSESKKKSEQMTKQRKSAPNVSRNLPQNLSMTTAEDYICSTPSSTSFRLMQNGSASASFSKIQFLATVQERALNRLDASYSHPLSNLTPPNYPSSSTNRLTDDSSEYYSFYDNCDSEHVKFDNSSLILSDFDNNNNKMFENASSHKNSTSRSHKKISVRYVHPEETSTNNSDDINIDDILVDKPIEFSLSDKD